jgi:hypothetical protein
MTMTRSKNSTFEMRICGRSMILGCIVFFRMELQWTSDMSDMYRTHLFFVLNLGGRSVTSIVIDVFCP